MAASNALRRSGRSSHTRATPPSRSTEHAAHMRNTPKRGSGIGACAAAARPRASDAAGVARVDHAVVPQACGRVARLALVLVALEDRLHEGRAGLLVHVLAACSQRVETHRQERLRGLARAHHRDARVRPHQEQARPEGAAAHAVVAGTVGAADHDGELGHLGAGDGHDELGAVLGDPAVLVRLADHEAGDVLQEDERDLALAGQLHEVRALERRLREEDAVVGDDRHGIAPDVREAAHERVAVERLELGEARAVDDPRDHLAHVERRALVGGDDAGELLGVARPAPRARSARATERRSRPRFATASRRSASACSSELGERIGHAGDARVHVAAAELLGGHLLAGRGLHERRPGEEDRARALHDDALVAHRRDVGAAGGARAHHGRELRDAFRRHARLVVEDAPEVLAVGEDLGLERQVGAARVDQVDAGQPVLERDLLRAQVLLDREREVGAALDGGVVRDDHALAAVHRADARHDAGAGRLVVVHAERRERRELEPGGVGIEQQVDALAHGQLAAAAVALQRGRAAALAHAREPRAPARRRARACVPRRARTCRCAHPDDSSGAPLIRV